MNEKIKNHVINLYMIALSDGHFAPEELETIIKIGEEKGFSKEEFEKTIVQPNIEFSIPEDFIERIKLLYDFVKVIISDQKIEEEEVNTFLMFCKKFQFEEERGKELFDWLIEMANQNLSTEDLEKEIEKQINQ